MSFVDFVEELTQEAYTQETPKERGPREPVSQKLHEMKYRMKGEGFRDAMNRIASVLSDNDPHFKEFREILLDMRFLPAGRIQSAIGSSRRVTAFNCFLSGPLEDNLVEGLDNGSFFKEGGIMARATEAAQTMRLGGGIGYDFSTLRPRGDRIKSMDTAASGPVSFMDIFDSVCRTIASAGHRRGAQMAVLRVDHPDIEEFIYSKQNTDHLNGFNISVGITDNFMKAVIEEKPFDLQWRGQIYKTVDAVTLWEQIMRSTWDHGEPGVLFMDTINRLNNLNYCETIAATNPCVTGDTLILTHEGYKRIDSLTNQLTKVWNGRKWSTVTPRITGENQPVIKITLSGGLQLECTKYHKFITKTKGRKNAVDLKVGDTLIKWDYPVIKRGETHHEAYTQGFFSGDGWVDQRDGRCYIDLHGDKKKLVDSLDVISWNENPIHGGFEGTDLTQTRYRCYMGQYLEDKDFVPNTSWDIASRLCWLEGLIDADGTLVGKNPQGNSICIGSVNLKFLEGVQRMLHTLGTYSHVALSIERVDRKPSYVLGIPSFYVTELKTLGFSPSRVDVSEIHTECDRRQYHRVISIEESNCANKVYCFNEPEDHTGIFNGIMTGQCAEQPLPPYGACLLGSFNLTAYVSLEEAYEDEEGFMVGYSFNWEQFIKDIPPVVRAMDNVIDVAIYPLKEQEVEAKNKRRMGLGITGLANAGEALGYPYGSQNFIEFEGKILKALLEAAYTTSALLAKEKGQFPWYDERYLKGEFIKRLEPETLALIKKFGMRNSHLTSIAPTGTISLCADNVSSGLEPVFDYKIERTILDFTGPKHYTVRDYGYNSFGIAGKRANECSADEHMGVLIEAYKYVDSAVSKTCNVDPQMPWEDFKAIYQKAWENDCKGCTTFNIGGKRMGIMKGVEEKEEPANGEACHFDPETGGKTCE